MKRLVSLVTMAATLLMLVALLAAPLAVMAQDGHGEGEGEGETGTEAGTSETEDADQAARRGAAVYAEFCQACHGPDGAGRGSSPAFPAIAFDPANAPIVIADGLESDQDDGIAMPGYGDVLSDAQIADLLAYLETWETGDTPPLPEPNVTLAIEDVPDYFGDAHAGAEIYAKFCVSCHGPDGEGRDGDAFPALEFDANDTRRITAEGAENVFMPAFSADAGGPLSEQELTDLETYLASWAVDEGEEEDESGNAGIAVMIVLLGVVAILAIGASYITRPPAEAGADED